MTYIMCEWVFMCFFSRGGLKHKIAPFINKGEAARVLILFVYRTRPKSRYGILYWRLYSSILSIGFFMVNQDSVRLFFNSFFETIHKINVCNMFICFSSSSSSKKNHCKLFRSELDSHKTRWNPLKLYLSKLHQNTQKKIFLYSYIFSFKHNVFVILCQSFKLLDSLLESTIINTRLTYSVTNRRVNSNSNPEGK